MTLSLNATRKNYKEFYGRIVEQMPKLVAEGRVPINASQLMQKRLDFRNGPADVKTAWRDNYFDTGDAVVYHPNGDVKIVLDSEILREINLNSQRNSGALILNEDIYKSLQGEVFKKDKLGKTESSLLKEDVKAHPVWKVLARDQSLLNDYADYIFAEGKERFGYDKAMGVYPSSCNGNAPELRAFYVDGHYGGSFALGRFGLERDSGRLAGVALEVLVAPSKGTEVKTYTIADVQTAKKQLDSLAQFVRPESLESVKSLLGKL